MRQVLGPGALGRPRGIGWRGRWEGGSGWGIHVTPWLIHVNVWQNPLKCCEVFSLQLIKINEKKKKLSFNEQSPAHQWKCKPLSHVSDSLWPHGLYSPWNSPGQNTVVGSLFLLQGIFPTQGSNPFLLNCRLILYQLSQNGSSRILEWVAYPSSRGSSWPRNQTGVSCTAGWFFTNWAIREDPIFPIASPSNKKAYTTFLDSTIRGQKEEQSHSK